MVHSKITSFGATLLLLVSCGPEPSDGFSYQWQKFSMDGHRTGVTPAVNGRLKETLGEIRDSSYIAPNGRIFDGATYRVAGDVMAVQDKMAPLRAIVGHSENGMVLDKPESALSNWVTDGYIRIAEKKTGMRIDLSLANFGGIRCDMPAGDVILNDIMSMFPFKNHFCIVQLKGRRIREIFEGIAASGQVQPAGGIRLEFENGHLAKAEIGGRPLQDDKVYNLATIDFLLDGGDRIYAGTGAEKVIRTEYTVCDGFLEYLKEIEAEGRSLDYQTDGRMIIR